MRKELKYILKVKHSDTEHTSTPGTDPGGDHNSLDVQSRLSDAFVSYLNVFTNWSGCWKQDLPTS